MEWGSKVIVLIRDALGVGAALFDSLRPLSPSKREVSSFDISSLATKYGIVGRETVTVEIAQFFAPDGSVQVSVLLLDNLQPPTAICAVNELMLLLTSDGSGELPMVILPYYIAAIKHKYKYTIVPPSGEGEAAIFGIEIGSSIDATQAMLNGVVNPPVGSRAHCEALSCLMHLIEVYKLPGIQLVCEGNPHENMAANKALEAVYKLGQFLADRIGLSFSRDVTCLKETEEEPVNVADEPWRAFYR